MTRLVLLPLVLTWIICLVALYSSFNNLRDSKYEHRGSNPKSPPLCRLPIVIPVFFDALGLMSVVLLLEDDQAIAKILEGCDLPLFVCKAFGRSRGRVNVKIYLLKSPPLS